MEIISLTRPEFQCGKIFLIHIYLLGDVEGQKPLLWKVKTKICLRGHLCSLFLGVKMASRWGLETSLPRGQFTKPKPILRGLTHVYLKLINLGIRFTCQVPVQFCLSEYKNSNTQNIRGNLVKEVSTQKNCNHNTSIKISVSSTRFKSRKVRM